MHTAEILSLGPTILFMRMLQSLTRQTAQCRCKSAGALGLPVYPFLSFFKVYGSSKTTQYQSGSPFPRFWWILVQYVRACLGILGTLFFFAGLRAPTCRRHPQSVSGRREPYKNPTSLNSKTAKSCAHIFWWERCGTWSLAPLKFSKQVKVRPKP